MPYVEDIVEPLIKTLDHTAGLPVHQLAGHARNLEFWVGEVAHAFEAIDGYPERFKRMTPPIRPGMSDHQLKELRREVSDAMVRVLRRCYKEGLTDDSELEKLSQKLSLYPEEIKRKK